ncbi:aromatic ring-hydroxylating dioxygenase subunit alpha [Phenylobacterium sp.]|uniref:aromatic ring-hydroxylating oxygenase subunit alpha n=1 Tax=Phenylobacterium sp. TaxID=1871053 RepID=UPI00301D2363
MLPGISAEEARRAALPLEEAWTLPPVAYLSEEIHALERERIFRRCWWPLARVDQLPEPGDYLTMEVLGQPLLVVHGTDGTFRVMSNVCLHRAAVIAEGRGRRRLFTCPYHAWAYDTAGRLVAAPLMDGAADFPPADCRLPQVRTEVWEGFVMANLDPDAPAFAVQARGLAAAFAAYGLADMAVVRTLTYESRWNWKVLVENFMEAYHHIGPHAATFEPAFHARDSEVLGRDEPWAILRMPPAGEAREPGLVGGLDDSQAGVLFAAAAFPHFLFAPHDNGMAWYQIFPHAADRLTLNIHVCTPGFARELADFEQIVEASVAFTDHVHQEDIAANDGVWRGLNAPLTVQGRLSPLEGAVWRLNRWWLREMGALD